MATVGFQDTRQVVSFFSQEIFGREELTRFLQEPGNMEKAMNFLEKEFVGQSSRKETSDSELRRFGLIGQSDRPDDIDRDRSRASKRSF